MAAGSGTAAHRAAGAAALEHDDVDCITMLRLPDQMVIDGDRADLVDHNGAVGERGLAQHAVEQGGLPAAEEPG